MVTSSFMVAPGVTEPGSVCDAPVDLLGIYPTLCDLAGVTIPQHVEGANLRPLLENAQSEWALPAICTHGRGNHMVQTKRYRLVHYASGEEEFYDRQTDPHEWTNLAGLEQTQALQAELRQWLPKQEVAEVAIDSARIKAKRHKRKRK